MSTSESGSKTDDGNGRGRSEVVGREPMSYVATCKVKNESNA